MKKVFIIFALIAVLFAVENYTSEFFTASGQNREGASGADNSAAENSGNSTEYSFPEFYRGIYLNVVSARKMEKLKKFVEDGKKANINTFVMDCQSSRYKKCVIPTENVKYCIDNGIHPIARIVVFPAGLRHYPVSKKVIDEKMKIAESACLNGFHEIQFDYIRFNDSNRLRKLTRKDRYAFIEGFLAKARKYLKKYNVKIAADVFGRIPLNHGDLIGQRMEGLDKVVDIICPMAYPSHYTWSKKLQNDPYHTVFITSQKANERTKQAEIVTYIQAFKMRLGPNSYPHYVKQQIKAVHDAGIKGYLLWNARQDYRIPFKVTGEYYSKKHKVSKNTKNSTSKKDKDSAI